MIIMMRFIAKKKWINVIKIAKIKYPEKKFNRKFFLFLFNKKPNPDTDTIVKIQKKVKVKKWTRNTLLYLNYL